MTETHTVLTQMEAALRDAPPMEPMTTVVAEETPDPEDDSILEMDWADEYGWEAREWDHWESMDAAVSIR